MNLSKKIDLLIEAAHNEIANGRAKTPQINKDMMRNLQNSKQQRIREKGDWIRSNRNQLARALLDERAIKRNASKPNVMELTGDGTGNATLGAIGLGGLGLSGLGIMASMLTGEEDPEVVLEGTGIGLGGVEKPLHNVYINKKEKG